MSKLISIVVPVFNEEESITPFFEVLTKQLTYPDTRFEVIFVNDGSTDDSQEKIAQLAVRDQRVRSIDFSRNFGKEAATTAGLHASRGDAVLMIDADLQHPPTLIPDFLSKWEHGAELVIGVRKNNASDSILKKAGSKIYYKLINMMSETKIKPRATDFRLLDRMVVDEFNKLTEHNRMTRGLIDWLGFRRDYIYFDAPERENGEASYGFWKLTKLATESFISYSLFPLRLAGYAGVLIMLLSGMLGVVMLVDRFINGQGLNFSGTAILANITLFLIGSVLVAIGLLSFYIANIYHETQNRPLYIFRKQK